jgi:hypothetical protein
MDRRIQILVAAIGLVGSLIGAGVSGFVTYRINQSEKTSNALGAARVMHENFRIADDAMRRSLFALKGFSQLSDPGADKDLHRFTDECQSGQKHLNKTELGK